MKCPVCGAVYRPSKANQESLESGNHHVSRSPNCRRCKADLSDLLRLHDQAMWHYAQALDLVTQEHYPEAGAQNHQALALYYSNADFHALAGKLSALQGEFPQAIASWQQALKFDPQHIIAGNCLQMIKQLVETSSLPI